MTRAVLWASARFFLVFVLALTTYSVVHDTLASGLKDDFRFHACYAASFDAMTCGGYSVYGPGVHVLARLVYAVVPDWAVAFGVVAAVLVWVLGAVLVDFSFVSFASFFLGFWFFLSTDWTKGSWIAHLATGILPTYAVMVLLAVLLVYQKRLLSPGFPWVFFILPAGLWFHHVAGWLLLLAAGVVVFAQRFRDSVRFSAVALHLIFLGLLIAGKAWAWPPDVAYFLFNERLVIPAFLTASIGLGGWTR